MWYYKSWIPPFILQNDRDIMQYSKFNNFYHYETQRLHENSTAEGFQTYSEKPLSFETGIIYLNIQIKYIFLSNLHVMVSMTVQEMNLQLKSCKCNQTNDYSSNCKLFWAFKELKHALFFMWRQLMAIPISTIMWWILLIRGIIIFMQQNIKHYRIIYTTHQNTLHINSLVVIKISISAPY